MDTKKVKVQMEMKNHKVNIERRKQMEMEILF